MKKFCSIIFLFLVFNACKTTEKEEIPQWQQNQVKVINEFFADCVAGNGGKKSYCPGDGIINNDIYGVQNWKVIDNNGTSQQVGRFDVEVSFDRDGEKSKEILTISLFRISEDALDYCIYKIVPIEEPKKQ